MAPDFGELKYRIAANKFYPPRSGSEQYLFRRLLGKKILEGKGKNHRIVLVEVRAGQGKSILADKVVKASYIPHLWYLIGPEDSDPVLLRIALLAALINPMPGFRSPLLEEMIPNGEIFLLELLRYANLLLGDLSPSCLMSSRSNYSALGKRLDTGGWLTLTEAHYCAPSRQGLSPCKMYRALLGAITNSLWNVPFFRSSSMIGMVCIFSTELERQDSELCISYGKLM